MPAYTYDPGLVFDNATSLPAKSAVGVLYDRVGGTAQQVYDLLGNALPSLTTSPDGYMARFKADIATGVVSFGAVSQPVISVEAQNAAPQAAAAQAAAEAAATAAQAAADRAAGGMAATASQIDARLGGPAGGLLDPAGQVVAAKLPDLSGTYATKNASSLTTGVLSAARVPDLSGMYATKDASSLTSGTIAAARIPDLSATYAPAATVSGQAVALGQSVQNERLNRLGFSESQRSVTMSRMAYDDALEFTERWTNLTAWTSTGVQVSAGKLAYLSGSPSGANHGITLGAGARIRASLSMVTGGTGAGIAVVGVSVAASGAAVTGQTLIGIGFDETGKPIIYRGTSTVAATPALTVLDTTAQPSGTYYATVTADATQLSFVLTTATGDKEWRFSTKFTAITGTVGNICAWVSDSRATAGTKIGALGYRAAVASVASRAGIEGLAPSVQWGYDPAGPSAIRVAVPATYDSRSPLPLVIYCHGSSGTETSVIDDPLMTPMYTALLSAGYAVASSSQRGNNWGNQGSMDDIVTLYRYVRDRYPLGQVFLLGQSMGGLSSLLTLADTRVGGIAAWCGIYPVCNLANMATVAPGTIPAAVKTAYGIASDGSDYGSKTAGHDPVLLHGSRFRGVPMRFYASTADTVVNRAANTDKLAALVAPYAAESAVVPHTGDHGDPSAFQPADVVAFFDRSRLT